MKNIIKLQTIKFRPLTENGLEMFELYVNKYRSECGFSKEITKNTIMKPFYSDVPLMRGDEYGISLDFIKYLKEREGQLDIFIKELAISIKEYFKDSPETKLSNKTFLKYNYSIDSNYTELKEYCYISEELPIICKYIDIILSDVLSLDERHYSTVSFSVSKIDKIYDITTSYSKTMLVELEKCDSEEANFMSVMLNTIDGQKYIESNGVSIFDMNTVKYLKFEKLGYEVSPVLIPINIYDDNDSIKIFTSLNKEKFDNIPIRFIEFMKSEEFNPIDFFGHKKDNEKDYYQVDVVNKNGIVGIESNNNIDVKNILNTLKSDNCSVEKVFFKITSYTDITDLDLDSYITYIIKEKLNNLK